MSKRRKGFPYAVGVDIACRMKLSVLDMPPSALDDNFNMFKEALEGGTRFGVGATHEKPQDHAVMDQDWSITRITREKKDLARSQLGHPVPAIISWISAFWNCRCETMNLASTPGSTLP